MLVTNEASRGDPKARVGPGRWKWVLRLPRLSQRQEEARLGSLQEPVSGRKATPHRHHEGQQAPTWARSRTPGFCPSSAHPSYMTSGLLWTSVSSSVN